MKIITKLIIGLFGFLLVMSIIYGSVLTSFLNQNNPVRTNLFNGENKTFFVQFPLYATPTMSLGITGIPVINGSDINLSNYGLLHYWQLEEASNPLVDSINSSYPILSDFTSVVGKHNKGINIVDKTGNTTIDLTVTGGNAWTVRCWVNTTNITTPKIAFSDWDNTGGQRGWFIRANGNDWAGRLHCSSQADTSSIQVQTNTWQHVVAKYDGANFYMFINGTGVSVPSQTCSPNNDHFSLGEDNGAIVSPFNGSIDECAIWGRALTSAEIAADYRAGIGQFLTYPENLSVYIGGTRQYNRTGIFNTSVAANFNSSAFLGILNDGCSCPNCTLSSNQCTIPTTFNLESPGILSINLTNATYFTNLTVNIYDVQDLTLITQPVSIDILGFGNFSTTTGTINIPQFATTPTTWTIFASSSNYVTNQKQFTLTDQNSTTFSMYLVNATGDNTGNLIVQVFDDFFNLVSGANVKLLEYQTASDSFVEVSQCFSNSNGECIFSVELNTKFYIITATATIDDNVVFAQSTSQGELIKLDNTIIELHLSTTERYDAPDDTGLVITVTNTTLVQNVSYLTAQFDDVNNNNHTVCIQYFFRRGTDEISLADATCVNGTSGIVNVAGGFNLTTTLKTNDALAQVYTLTGGIKKLYDEYVYPAFTPSFKGAWTVYVKYIVLAVLLGVLAFSLWIRNIAIFGGGAIVLSLTVPFFDPTLLGAVTTIFIIILGIMIIAMTYKRKLNA